MDQNIFVFFLWILTVYHADCSNFARVKPKRGGLIETEPHPYTISFFTFPKGAATELLESKRESKRDNQDLSTHQKITEAVTAKKGKSEEEQNSSVSVDSKATKTSLRVSKMKETTTSEHNKKHHQPFSQVSEKPSVLDKAGKVTDEEPQAGRQRVQPLEPWNLGPSHNKIQFTKNHAATNQELSESYQEGSINHPSHTMYPQCHHCPRNSSYEDCVSKTTLQKCDNGLNNICFTKSFQSSSRGILYEMGCSNHAKCMKAKAAPCKGSKKKCFVCCQFDGCNAQEHHYFQSTKNNNDENLGYSAFNNKATTCWKSKWSWVLILSLQLVAWMLI